MPRTLTLDLQHAPTALTVSGATLTLRDADGEIVFGPAAAAVSPAGASTGHTLSCATVPDSLAGVPLSAGWWWLEELEEATATVSVTLGSPYPAIYTAIRSSDLLGVTSQALPDDDAAMARVVPLLVDELLRRAPCLGTDYAAIAGLDRLRFDSAVAHKAAARLRPALIAAGKIGGGSVVREKWGDDEVQYATPQATRQESGTEALETVWEREGERQFRLISCVAESRRGAVAPALFQTASRRRSIDAACGRPRGFR